MEENTEQIKKKLRKQELSLSDHIIYGGVAITFALLFVFLIVGIWFGNIGWKLLATDVVILIALTIVGVVKERGEIKKKEEEISSPFSKSAFTKSEFQRRLEEMAEERKKQREGNKSNE